MEPLLVALVLVAIAVVVWGATSSALEPASVLASGVVLAGFAGVGVSATVRRR